MMTTGMAKARHHLFESGAHHYYRGEDGQVNTRLHRFMVFSFQVGSFRKFWGNISFVVKFVLKKKIIGYKYLISFSPQVLLMGHNSKKYVSRPSPRAWFLISLFGDQDRFYKNKHNQHPEIGKTENNTNKQTNKLLLSEMPCKVYMYSFCQWKHHLMH
jgi:hypothetical protein